MKITILPQESFSMTDPETWLKTRAVWERRLAVSDRRAITFDIAPTSEQKKIEMDSC